MEVRHIPAFASEAEEAQWWFDHREERDKELADAIASCAARPNHVKDLLRKKTEPESTTVTLEFRDALKAASLAERKGVDVQTYLANLIHISLQNELQALHSETDEAA